MLGHRANLDPNLAKALPVKEAQARKLLVPKVNRLPGLQEARRLER